MAINQVIFLYSAQIYFSVKMFFVFINLQDIFNLSFRRENLFMSIQKHYHLQQSTSFALNHTCHSYFDLIERVGSQGKYQFNLMLIFVLTWFVLGMLLLSTAFLFLNPSFHCKEFGLLTPQDCSKYVCLLPKSERNHFIPKTQKQFISLANNFNQYYCEDSIDIDLASSFTYFGTFIGFVTISFFSDNWGRRKSIVLSWGIGCLGIIILIFSQNLFMGAIGLFLCGFGCDCAGHLCFFIMSQVVQNKKRQQYAVIILPFFVVGALFITWLFYLLQNWRLVCVFGMGIPMFLTLFLMMWYLQETPQFLLKKDKEMALKSLNRIGLINKGKDNLITEKDIEDVLSNQINKSFQNKLITPFDIFRYKSLRINTICGGIINLSTYCMYFGPSLIIGSLGDNIYVNNTIMNLADLATYLPAYFIIDTIPRKTSCIVLFAMATVTSGILIFVNKPESCDYCAESILELVLIFIFRFCISLQFSIFILYCSELYPGRARALGNGIISSTGTIGSTLCPVLIGALNRAGINLMIFFTIMGVVAIGNLTLLKQTVGKKITEEIQEAINDQNSSEQINDQNSNEQIHGIINHEKVNEKIDGIEFMHDQ